MGSMTKPTKNKHASALGKIRSPRKAAAVAKNLIKARRARSLRAIQARLVKYKDDPEGLRRAVRRAERKAEYRRRKGEK